jgi:hypothetical protein
MANIAPQAVSKAGLNASYTACAGGGDTITDNDGRVFLHVKNGHTSPQSVTIDSPEQCSHGGTHDVQVSVPNAEERMIGPFDPKRFGASLALTYSGVTALTIAAIKVPAA